jgi:putative ABC transport system permease protein
MFRYFAAIAIIISCLGLFGLSTFIIARRTKEIGIRKVNGATAGIMLLMLNREFLKWVALAFILACPLAWYAMNRWLQTFAYRIDFPVWTFAAAGLIALAIALVTVSAQSYMAAMRNPVEALRYE